MEAISEIKGRKQILWAQLARVIEEFRWQAMGKPSPADAAMMAGT